MQRCAPSPSGAGAVTWCASAFDAVAARPRRRSCAPRFFACSSSSRTTMPAPSPITKPSRSLSNGRLRLLRVVVARRQRAHRVEAADAEGRDGRLGAAADHARRRRRARSRGTPRRWRARRSSRPTRATGSGPWRRCGSRPCPGARLTMIIGDEERRDRGAGPSPTTSCRCPRSSSRRPGRRRRSSRRAPATRRRLVQARSPRPPACRPPTRTGGSGRSSPRACRSSASAFEVLHLARELRGEVRRDRTG